MKDVFVVVIPVILGMLLGGLLGKVGHSIMKLKLYLFYVCSGGMLIGFLCFEIIPESIGKYDLIGLFFGYIIGILGMLLIDRAIHHYEGKDIGKSLTQPLLFIIIAISLHNVPTGIAYGTSISNDPSFSPLLLALVLHHIPEGIALSMSIMMANINFLSFIFFSVFLSLILGISILIGYEYHLTSGKANAILMGGAIGTFSFVILFEFLFKAYRRVSFLEFYLFFILGIIVIKMYLYFLS